MIADLHIRDLGVIAEADLELSGGMVVFTGETGAGKTVLVGALGLVLGDRADTGVVAGERAQVSARILVDPRGGVAESVVAAGGAVDPDGTITITRSVAAAGRSRAVLGGAPVPVSVLADIGGALAQRHSQSDQISLRSPRRQRRSLDAFAGAELRDALAGYQDIYRSFLAASDRLRSLQEQRAEHQRRAAELRDGLARIDAVQPDPADDDRLPDEINRLSNSEQLSQQVADAVNRFDDGQDGVVAAIAASQQSLTRAAAVDPGAKSLADRLDELAVLAVELDADLRRYAADLRCDPGALESLQRRRAALAPLQRDFGPQIADVVQWAQNARGELARLAGAGEEETATRELLARLVADLGQVAVRVNGLRCEAAERLGAAVTAELRDLAMPHAAFSVSVEQHDADNGLVLPDGRSVAFGENGTDTVRFQLAPHPGADPAPIGDGASGGELSRIMLALEVVLAESDPPAVFVFDEVDAGIGGRTAIEVGSRLARLAQRSQVLVVTHLAQVAAFADQQVVVRKDSTGRVTRSSAVDVAGADRRRELARMLSGQDDSAAALAHAGELLDLAAGQRGPGAAAGAVR